ncbi:MAG: extracellular solute-binding protein [Christensenellales bacterium]|jgi:putative aldouronate transport system substrate-binding protein
MKRTLALLLTMLMIFSLASCGPATPADDSTSQPQSSGTASATSTTSNVVQTEPPQAEVAPTIHIFGSRSVNSPEDRNTMQLVQAWSEAVNVNFEWELVATGYADIKSLKLASGDWPDVFMSVTNEEIIKYGNEGVFIPLQELQEQHCPLLMERYGENPDLKAYMTAPDGNIYTFPFYSIGPWGGMNRFMVINTTWLDNVGKSMPTTLAEFKDVLTAFLSEDANGNGDPNDEIPLSWAGSLSGNHPMGWAFAPDFISASFQCPYPYNNDHMGYEDGKVLFIPASEEYRNWVRWMGELYAEGLLDPQGFTHGTDQYAAKLNTDPYIVGVASVWDIGDSFADPGAYDHYDFIPPMKGLNGEDPVVQYNLGYGGRDKWAVTTACENPEAVMRAADYCFQPDITVQFLEGPYDVRLIPCETCGQAGAYEAGPAPEGMDNTTFRDSVGLFGATPVYIDIPLYGEKLHLHYTDHKVNYINTIMMPYADPDPMPPFFMSVEETAQKSEIWTDLCEYVNRKGAEFVINNNIDAEWDAYLLELEKIGYKKAVDAQQTAIDRALGN